MNHWKLIAAITIFFGLNNAWADRYKLPPPRSTQLLPTAQGMVYDTPSSESPGNPALYCVTTGGSCALPAPAETGLSCICESDNPKFSYGGRTGAIPPMPEWADPRLPPR